MPSSLPLPLNRTPITDGALADLNLLNVMKRLVYCKGTRGRATPVVLRGREVFSRQALPEPEPKTQVSIDTIQSAEKTYVLGSRDYVLKLVWRELGKRSVGEGLVELVGVYGLTQHLWYDDAFKAKQCLDATLGQDEGLACENSTNLDIVLNEEDSEEEVEYNPARIGDYSTTRASCPKQVYCRLLMSTVGEPLWAAESPRRLLEAVLDSILGYWRLFNKGVLYRDISDGNVMMLQEGQQFDHREWKEVRPTTDSTADPRTSSSEELLRQYLKKLGRDPRGVLSDFDLSATRPEMEKTFFGDILAERNAPTPSATVEPRRSTRHKGNSRPSSIPTLHPGKGLKKIDFHTGTPTFMSSRVLRVPIGQPYKHHLLDDLESFFWLILWSTAAHLDPQVHKGTYAALTIVNNLDQLDLVGIYFCKKSLLSDCDRSGGRSIRGQLASFGNGWAKDRMIVSAIVDLGSFFYRIVDADLDTPAYEPDVVFPCVVDMILKALGA
ncbi:hypothetical protein FRC10_006283 [Ceratobasidium sp. 414]|nr:hypothetical protein FRC10_006283 [Ceratobasidium sp. 414]